MSIGGDTIISGPAFDANGNPIPTPQTLGGLSNRDYPVHRYQPATPALSPAPVHPRLSAPPPRRRGGSAKGLLRAQQVTLTRATSLQPRQAMLKRRERSARAMLADPAEGSGWAQGAAEGSLATAQSGVETITAAAGGDAAASADPAAAASGGGEAAGEALPVAEEQPTAVHEQGLPANQLTGLAAGALPDVDGKPAEEAGLAAAAAAAAQAATVATDDSAGQQASGVVQPEAVPGSSAVAADGAAADAAGGGADQVASGSVVSAGLQAAAAVEPAAGASGSAPGTAGQTAPPSPQEQACSGVACRMPDSLLFCGTHTHSSPDSGEQLRGIRDRLARELTGAARVYFQLEIACPCAVRQVVQDTARFRPQLPADEGGAKQPLTVEQATWEFFSLVPSAYAGVRPRC